MRRPLELNVIWLLKSGDFFKASFKQDIYALGATFYYIQNKHENDKELLKALQSEETTQEEYDVEELNYYISNDFDLYDTLVTEFAISPPGYIESDPLTYIYRKLPLPRMGRITVDNPLLRSMLDSVPSKRPSIEEIVEQL